MLFTSSHGAASVFYKFDIVAQTGANSLTHISHEVSINDKGRVAFIGYTNASTNAFNTIWIGDGYGSQPRRITSSVTPFISAFRDFAFPQINNNNLVVASDRFSGSPQAYHIRTWNSDSLSSFMNIAEKEDFTSVTLPSISNDGLVSYVEIGSGYPTTNWLRLYDSPITWHLASYGDPIHTNALPPVTMAADGGRLVLRPRARALDDKLDDPIVLFHNFTETIIADFTDFFALGHRPGISDDGSIVVFCGDLKPGKPHISDTAGPGIFASIEVVPDLRIIIRVAGNPAELGYDAGGNKIRMGDFDMHSRAGVSRLDLGSDYSFVVCFKGTPSSAGPINPATGKPLLFSGQPGVWAVRVDVEPNFFEPADPSSFRPRSPLPVIQIGDKLPPGSGKPIAQLAIYDPIANAAADQAGVRTQRRGDHYVAFWAAIADEQFAVRAAHLDSDEDGLVDHWETDGIDVDQDGSPDLQLHSMGALPDKRDLFVHIDWLADQVLSPFLFAPQDEHVHRPQPEAIDFLVNMFANAPPLVGRRHGFRSDGNPPPNIQAGITLHVDAGPLSGLSRNMPAWMQRGGHEVGTPGAPDTHLDVVYFGMPGSVSVPGLKSMSLHEIKTDYFSAVDKGARELVFHYVFMADWCELYPSNSNPIQGTATGGGGDQLDTAISLPVGPDGKGLLEEKGIAIVGGTGVGQSRRIISNKTNHIVVGTPWETKPDNTSRFVTLEPTLGRAELAEAFTSPKNVWVGNDVVLSCRLLYERGFGDRDYLATSYAYGRILAHELGHNLGLYHCGSPDPGTCGCEGLSEPDCILVANSYKSLMSYSHVNRLPEQYPPGMIWVNDFSRLGDGSGFADWDNLRMDFQNYFASLGTSLLVPPELRVYTPIGEMTLTDVLANNPGPMDLEPTSLRILLPVSGSLITVGASPAVSILATDNVAVASVLVSFDANGNGSLADPGESVTASPVGSDIFAATFSNVSGPPGGRTINVTALDAAMHLARATSVVVVASSACSYAITPGQQSFAAAGGSNTIALSTGGGCPWMAQPSADWITLPFASSGSGNAAIQVAVASNKWAVARAATITIAGQTFSVNQAAGLCSYGLSGATESFSSDGGAGSINVSASSGCSWSAWTPARWMTITSGRAGQGNGTIEYVVGSNPDSTARSTTIVVENQTLLVTQAGAPSTFRITDMRRLPNGDMHLSYPANVNSYYILYRGTNLAHVVGADIAQSAAAIDIGLGTSGSGSLNDAAPIAGATAAFYRVRELQASQALDSDHDGIDDVYELRLAAFLNPLSPSDAALDFDADGVSNRDEYLRGSNPADPPTSSVAIHEGNGGLTNVLVLIGLTSGSAQTNVVLFTTADGSARIADNDYVATNGTLVFLPGETRKALVVSVRGDTQTESNETFYLNLSLSSAPPGISLAATQVVCTIVNDDSPPGTVPGLVSLEASGSTLLAAVSPCDFNCGSGDTDVQLIVLTNRLVGTNDHAHADARARRNATYASATADASPGLLSVLTWADAEFPAANATYTFYAINKASYRVAMRAMAAGIPPGEDCKLKVRFHITGQLGWLLDHIQGSNSQLSARCTFEVNGLVLDSRLYQDRQLLDGNTNSSRFPPEAGETMEIMIPVKNGQLFTNKVSLETTLWTENLRRTGPGGSGSFLGLANFSPGAYWDGVVALYDAQNQEIPDFTIESPTLIDWRQSLKPPDAPPVDSYNPPIPVSLAVEPTTILLTNITQKVPLMVTGMYSNGTTADLTAAAAWTVYKSYNRNIATVDRNGVVTGLNEGQTVVQAENQGAVKSVLVIVSTSAPPRTVTGQVRHRNGQPAVGARVTVVESLQAATTDINGFFLIPGVPAGISNTITVLAAWQTNALRGFRQAATSPTISAGGTGLIDLGTIVLNTFFDLRAARMLSSDNDDDRVVGLNTPVPDKLPSGWELLFGYEPTRWDTDRNGIDDPEEDPDEDGLTNLQEYQNGTDPFGYDSDGDLWDDRIEISAGGEPHLPSVIPRRLDLASPQVSTFLTGSVAGSTVPPAPLGMFIVGAPPVRAVLVVLPAGNLTPPQSRERLILAQPPITTFVTGIPDGTTMPPGQQFIIAQPPVTVRTNSP